MMNDPLITIVTPSFNQSGFLRATIESVLGQAYPALEYIVMDGGSTDGSDRIAAEYGSRLTWISERDRGQAHAINKGFERARGAVVAWVNSDDVLLPGAAEAAAKAIAASPCAGGVYGEGLWIDADGNRIRRFEATRDFDLWRLVFLEDYILQPACFFRRDAVAACGWLDESLHWTMDWDLLIRLGMNYGLVRTGHEMAALREHRATKTATGGSARLAEIAAMLRRYAGGEKAPGRQLYELNERRDRTNWRPERTALTAAIDRLHRLAQGLDPELMAGPRCRFMAPRGTQAIRVEGEVPEWRREATLRVICSDLELGRHQLACGEFEIEVRVPPPFHGAAVLFEIRSNGGRWVWPRREIHLAHRVCWRLRRITFL